MVKNKPCAFKTLIIFHWCLLRYLSIPSTLSRQSKRFSCFRFPYGETEVQGDEIPSPCSPKNQGQIRSLNPGFLTSRMRAFTNSSDNSLCLYLKVNLSHLSGTWLAKVSIRYDSPCLSQIASFRHASREQRQGSSS